MEKKEYTDATKHRNSLLRIAACCEFPRISYEGKDNWEIEDMILQRLDQGKLAKKRGLAENKRLRKEIDMLRQTSIFDFLKVHYEEIRAQETGRFMEDDG